MIFSSVKRGSFGVAARIASLAVSMALLAAAPAGAEDAALSPEQEWRSKAAQQVQNDLYFPPSVWSKGVTGKGKLALTVSRDGTVTATEIIEEPEHPALKKAIRMMQNMVETLPAPPQAVKGDAIRILAPLDWTM
ncbi:energy transducer TonB [Yunchengibacter salinarum]|uniref:energy transducer TonB n=1 Tax=Yunchengibacter salinarum TaxID=3133399 RepID=UPI0035B63BAA